MHRGPDSLAAHADHQSSGAVSKLGVLGSRECMAWPAPAAAPAPRCPTCALTWLLTNIFCLRSEQRGHDWYRRFHSGYRRRARESAGYRRHVSHDSRCRRHPQGCLSKALTALPAQVPLSPWAEGHISQYGECGAEGYVRPEAPGGDPHNGRRRFETDDGSNRCCLL